MMTKKKLMLPENWLDDQNPLRRYFHENFLNFCRESKNTELLKRANSIEKSLNKENRIDSIYNKQKYKVWLFFDELYDKRMDDNHDITPFTSLLRTVKPLEEHTFKPIYSFILKKKLSFQYYQFLLGFMEKENYLLINHSYIPHYFAFENNQTPKHYRLSEEVYSSNISLKYMEVDIPQKEIDRYSKSPKKTIPKYHKELMKKLGNHFGKWKIDKKEVFLDLRKRKLPFHKRFTERATIFEEFNKHNKEDSKSFIICDNGYWVKSNYKFGQRFYHKNAQMKKICRKHINFEDRLGDKCLVEHRNCLIYLLTRELLKYKVDNSKFKDTSLLILIDKLKFDTIINNEIKDSSIEIFKNLIISRGKDFNSRFFQEEFNLNKEEVERLKKTIYYCGAEFENELKPPINPPSDIWTLLVMSKLGIVYDVLFSLLKNDFPEVKHLIKRKEFKTIFNVFLNIRDYVIPYSSEILIVISYMMEVYFPTFFEKLIKLKYNNHKNVAKICFRMESKLIVQTVAVYLLDHKLEIPFYTIHDGIVCYKEHAEFVKKLVEKKSKELFDLTSPIEIENVE